MPNERYVYILLSEEKWWDRLCGRNRNSRKIHAFVRRSRVGPLRTQKLLFYVNKPIMQIRGVADFVERLVGYHKELWDAHGNETCFKTFSEYVVFLRGRTTATFIRFTNFRELIDPISMEMISKVLGVLRMPPMGKYLNRETANQLII
jgi:predicted transcriptional regulator